MVIIAIGIVFLGGRFLGAPAARAEGFGVLFPRSDAYAYLAAKGTRDIVSTLLLITLLTMSSECRVLGAFIPATLIPVGDFFTVVAYAGRRYHSTAHPCLHRHIHARDRHRFAQAHLLC
jgi:hypothetical protein